ncbi:hypothetical protein QWI17_10800 [Gilvimarinus sp. SDUM040013]|uniref:Uncharacterized protein n=1 Tax=Gilvimarinus gilvus TaxID=3058038 RepID=A0ABU4RYN1_9GAMM|nr:hypothetical protein [Gilvimarinus sp. SDUM040013]MDO3386327.1 hypothetical protein [Gilvimarinus sp. SDUM040013]MDX6850015.1 hypothetical protein [Gilvimarinus sp. SDUM040013]
MADYHENIFSEEESKVIEAFSFAINKKDFFLSKDQLAGIESKFSDEKVSGWVFAYNAYQLSNQERIRLLKSNMHNSNPRIREQVCDIVGDECISDLRQDLKELFGDHVSYVSQAAKYNHDEMF